MRSLPGGFPVKARIGGGKATYVEVDSFRVADQLDTIRQGPLLLNLAFGESGTE